MKRKFVHPAPSARELAGPKYWRSLDEPCGDAAIHARSSNAITPRAPRTWMASIAASS